ncbi:MAG: M20/M25/M40 family metallo-hydrolase [Xanthomonadales bacterium]|nr:M20/M25/M40 family metallo-hydrolase [Xanthomonadales bacterium]
MRLPLALLLGSTLLASANANANANATTIPAAAVRTAEQLRDKALHDDTGYRIVESLTTEVGPRMAGSAADQRGRDWAVAKFKALGYDKVYTEPVTYPLWERHGERGAIVAPFPQPLVLTALGYSPGTPKGGITAQVLQVASIEALQAMDPAQVKGKIIYISFHTSSGKQSNSYHTGRIIREEGPIVSFKKGAAAFLMRTLSTDVHNRLASTGATGPANPTMADLKALVPAAALSPIDADQLERVLAYGKPVTLLLDLDCGIAGEYTGANVIGEITGKKHPDQVVAIGGHLDSWDPGTGAVDDGAGVAIAIAAGKLIRDLPQRPDRTIRVIAFANEEMGLWGGTAYAKEHAREVGKFQLGSESDHGAAKIWQMSATVKPGARNAIAQMAQVLAPLGVAYDANLPGSGGPDLSLLHAKGMAALTLAQDGTYYSNWHHNANDTLDKIVPSELAQNVAVYAAVVYMAAQADGDFGSGPGAFAADQPKP